MIFLQFINDGSQKRNELCENLQIREMVSTTFIFRVINHHQQQHIREKERYLAKCTVGALPTPSTNSYLQPETSEQNVLSEKLLSSVLTLMDFMVTKNGWSDRDQLLGAIKSRKLS
ncbi:uncharacterized protein LOC130500278 [Raphanus sativus]|uniref:Uncharacterized protein LOC130500278 n=1 Tax=Raphanus sativus TaxID=3726 RepID=A0A9W3CHV7_RAPSA|nr:uncharacterized protein LOC130500278 [Raphanus sativus]XP_056851097.1 uncharacterized protein LOC130500278 [Raphanus sativus]